ncbi:hypothetical protein [Deinococcus yunweiensis]|uniref:hypothetical protein n=1 Tax=Deinococcus yunweiensis TaxID=367282 RepID=UPI00398EFFE8
MPSRPGLLLYLPADWDADPPALAELRRHLSDEYGATLEICSTCDSPRGPAPLYTGAWRSWPGDEVRLFIQAAFFSLDWLEMEDVE